MAVKTMEKNKENAKNINLPMNRHGYLVLPSWEAINQEGHIYKKFLTSKFMTQLYNQRVAGGGKGRIPWARLSEALDDFILPKYLLNNIMLTQYHHIHVEDADALLGHWTQSQAAREILFQFKNSVNVNWCGKKVSDQGANQRGCYGIPRRTRNEWVTEHPKEVVRDPLSRCLADRAKETLPGTQADDKRPAQAAEAHEELPTEEDGGDDILYCVPSTPSLTSISPEQEGPYNQTSTIKSQESLHKHKKNNGASASADPSKCQKVGQANVQLEPLHLSHPQWPVEWVKEDQLSARKAVQCQKSLAYHGNNMGEKIQCKDTRGGSLNCNHHHGKVFPTAKAWVKDEQGSVENAAKADDHPSLTQMWSHTHTTLHHHTHKSCPKRTKANQ
ncbi:hypothetical protein EI94DRAFT_1698710 [Lactarius quietus]|nr:hypothetical protein EI94DRAFT_1698710 [Lactarius quietus]